MKFVQNVKRAFLLQFSHQPAQAKAPDNSRSASASSNLAKASTHSNKNAESSDKQQRSAPQKPAVAKSGKSEESKENAVNCASSFCPEQEKIRKEQGWVTMLTH